MNNKETNKTEKSNKKLWVAPQVKSFGNAVDVIKATNVLGSGDADYSIIAS